MFKKILIANRGEIALRIIRTCHEMSIKTVAVYSTVDKDSLHVRFANEAICIGPSSIRESYLNIKNIISAAEITNADAIHPGYGFLSENASFSKACKNHGIKFIGADSDHIEKMGNKLNAKITMLKAGVPCISGSDGVIKDLNEALYIADNIGYPVMLKSTFGGGGKGMRLVWNKKDLEKKWYSSTREATSSFGNGLMYIEKFIENPRHIEIQIASDCKGNACHLSERDCSIQRRHQKLVEETPSPFMTNELRNKMGNSAIIVAEHIGYEGLGTVEFLVDKDRNFYFIEMNTRIQVEHTITEEVLNFDLIREQIYLAHGEMILGKNYYPKLHSIECRINAEDPFNNFKPYSGKILEINKPGGYGVRVDTHIYSGYTIFPYYDSMICKLITTSSTRHEAIAKMRRALDEFYIEGIKTIIPFHRQLMNNKDFIAGNYTTKFMENFIIDKEQSKCYLQFNDY